jgi:hypothetical protein
VPSFIGIILTSKKMLIIKKSFFLRHMRIIVSTISLLLIACSHIAAQDTLPKFKAIDKTNGKTIISWIHYYPNVRQLTIMRSTDSLKNFIPIANMPNPDAAQNGYTDGKYKLGKLYYYRIYIMQAGGKFFYTPSQRPAIDSSWKKNLSKGSNGNTIENKFTSKYVFSNASHDVVLKLYQSAINNYEVKFYDGQKLIIHLKDIKDDYLILEKLNFKTKGCYRYEVLKKGKIDEMHLVCL